MRGVLRLCVSLWLFAAAAAWADDAFVPSGQPRPELSVSLVTFQPGPIYWERFGHVAILLRDISSGQAITFNYGLFDFHQRNFFLNFARGHMRYLVAANALENDLPIYAEDGRWALEQKLALTPEQVGWLRDYLVWNVQPAHREYGYDYFVSNCATKVRDALDGALGGALRRQLEGRSSGSSYRREALRLIAPERPLFLAMDAALGPVADRPADVYALAFSPLQLMQAVRAMRVVDAAGAEHPLVQDERYLLPAANPALDPKDAPPDLRVAFLLLGLFAAGALWVLHASRTAAAARYAFALLATLSALALAAGGWSLLAIWCLTEHWTGWGNGNLLLFSPLVVLLLPGLVTSARRRWQPSRFTGVVVIAIGALAILECALRLTPPMAQQNLHWCLLVLPVWFALGTCVWRQRRAVERL